MKNDTDSPREGTSSFIFVFLTLGDSAVYNMDRAGVTTCSFFYRLSERPQCILWAFSSQSV